MKQRTKLVTGLFLASVLISLSTLGAVAATNPSILGMSGDLIQDQDRDRDQDCIQDCDCDQDCCQDCDCDQDQDQNQDQDQDQNQDQDCNPT